MIWTPAARQWLRIASKRLFSTQVSTSTQDHVAYCVETVRKYDQESFLISHFYPSTTKEAYFALKAFYVELAKVQDNVSNLTIGRMRMQFWRDAVKNIGLGEPPRHPIAQALFNASQTANIQIYHLNRIIDARDSELETSTHLTVESLVSHAESTSSTLLYTLLPLLMKSASSSDSSKLYHAASHLGVAQTMMTLLRALPYHASQRRVVIPAEITARHGVVHEEVFRRGGEAGSMRDAVWEFASAANEQLNIARKVFGEVEMTREAMPIFLAAAPVALFLERLEKANFDAFDQRLQIRHWKLPWRIWRSYYKRDF